MHAASTGVTEQEEDAQGIDQQDIVDRVVFVLAALTVGRFSRVLGADDAPFRPVMGTRGEAETATGAATTGAGASASAPTTEAASAAATPSRCARAARERVGASPRVRSAASSTGKRTWIH